MSEFKKVKNNVYPEFYLPLHTCMAGYFIKDEVVNNLLRFRDDNLKAGKFGKCTVYSQKYKKGSFLGLEMVYDEIYHRLYKEKEALLLSDVLDSLYLNSDVFVSRETLEQ